MHKKSFAVICIFLCLFVAVWISLKLNQPNIEEQKKLLENAEILLLANQQEYLIGLNDLMEIGEEEFTSVLDTSSTNPTNHKYTGVQLKNILSHYQIDLDESSALVLSGMDNYSVAYTTEEILKNNNVYIVFKEDDSYLGSKENGGRGPYESIVVADDFSNRRCKWLTRIECVK